MDPETTNLDNLRPEEIRVLGALIEKSVTTPDYYPLTLNSLTTACNQKSARKPVVNYGTQEVILTLDSLQKKGYVTTESGAYSRSEKYEHRFNRKFELSSAQLAIMCLLFLRGPLTAGEIKSASGRLYAFESLQEVHDNMNELRNLETPLIKELPKQAGQKEQRSVHLFQNLESIEVESDESNENISAVRQPITEMEERIEKLENQVAELSEKLNKLLEELN